jgi:DNA polymerase III delta prime subunit
VATTAESLDLLIGLRTAKRLLQRLVSESGQGQSVLLYGAPGSGKNALARLLAEAWLCKLPTAEGADGTCRACNAFSRGNNADFLLIQPQGLSRIIPVRAIGPTQDRKPEDPPNLQEFLRTLPLLSRHKVVIIEDADRMNGPAFNSLLKTLEEPPAHARLILTTPQVGALPATILSRCLAIACESPTADDLRTRFPDASDAEIGLAEGTPGRLSEILARRDLNARLIRYADSLVHRPPGEALVAADELRAIAEGYDNATGSGARTANAEILARLATLCARNPGMPPTWTQALVEAHRRIVGNANPTVVFDALLANMLLRRTR